MQQRALHPACGFVRMRLGLGLAVLASVIVSVFVSVVESVSVWGATPSVRHRRVWVSVTVDERVPRACFISGQPAQGEW